MVTGLAQGMIRLVPVLLWTAKRWHRDFGTYLLPSYLVWLIAAFAKGDEADFERLYAETREKLFLLCAPPLLRRQDLAEEVIHVILRQDLEQRLSFHPLPVVADHVDGVDRAKPAPSTWCARE